MTLDHNISCSLFTAMIFFAFDHYFDILVIFKNIIGNIYNKYNTFLIRK